jgi:hypothetical protein
VTIQNQAFTPYTITDADGFNQTINLYYKVRSKGHFEEQWTQPKEGIYQIADYGAKKTTFYLYPDTTPANGQIDFQAQASIGYTYWKPNPNVGNTFAFGFTYFSGRDSNWSETQTITINDPNGGANHYYQLPEGLQSTACIEPTPQTPTLPPPTTPTSPAQNPTTTPTQAISGTDVELAANWENTTIILLCITALVSAVSLQFLHERNMKRHS